MITHENPIPVAIDADLMLRGVTDSPAAETKVLREMRCA
jgi:hypothetical protein